MLDFSDYPELDYILSRDGFIIFVDGMKDDGKTDMCLLLLEYCYEKGYRTNIKTNVFTENYMISFLDNKPDLDLWLRESGRKAYYMDEIGTIIKKMRFMSKINLEMLDIIQLIRKFKCGFIGSAPTDAFVESGLLNTDIYDAHIHKESRTSAMVKDNLNKTSYSIDGIPKTSIKFDTDWIATFHLKKQIDQEQLPMCCKVARVYSETQSYRAVRERLKIEDDKQVQRFLIKHCEHTT